VKFVYPVTILGAAACIYTMFGLPVRAWERFAIWLVIGMVLYFAYGYRHSTLTRGKSREVIPPAA
jgi:APA family basic amino acid/polyamine antiporter